MEFRAGFGANIGADFRAKNPIELPTSESKCSSSADSKAPLAPRGIPSPTAADSSSLMEHRVVGIL